MATSRDTGDRRLRGALPRRRPLQDHQRQPRPPGGRRAAGRHRAPAGAVAALHRHRRHGSSGEPHAGAPRRRRVHDPARRRADGGGRAGGRRAAASRPWRSRSICRAARSSSRSASASSWAPSATGGREDMVRDADTAMYRAKALGKARCEVFDTSMLAAAEERLQARIGSAARARAARAASSTTSRSSRCRTPGSAASKRSLRWQHPTRGLDPAGAVHPDRRGDRPDRADRSVGARRSLPADARLGRRSFPSAPA